MTLTDLIPSLRPSLQPALDPGLWPLTARSTGDGELTVGGVPLSAVAARYGTPAYVVDESDVRERCRAYRGALLTDEVAYAGKAFLCREMARWATQEGLSLDVCSAGELAVARSVGFPAERIILHGNAKTPDDLRAALDYRVGRIVLDSAAEVPLLAALLNGTGRRQKVLLRVTPGLDVDTHPALTTGVNDQKFGCPLAGGAAAEAVRRIVAQPDLELVGLHCHLGSQVSRLAAVEEAARRLIALMAAVRDEHHLTLSQLDLGGGHAVPYRLGDPEFDLTTFVSRVRMVIRCEAAAHRLPVPRITVEPGRAIAARAGVTLYRVITVKRLPAGRTYVAVDGGMGDNPRPALYGAQYTIRLVGRPLTAPTMPVTVVGRYCEGGDILIRDAPLPDDVRPGDLLATACTGAYHHSMACTYNLVGRPPVVAVRDGVSRTLVRRETYDDLLDRDTT